MRLETFQQFINEQISRYKLSNEECSKLFDLPISSIERYRSGDVIPAVPIQRMIYNQFVRLQDQCSEN